MAGNDFLFANKKVPPRGPCFNCPDRNEDCHSVCEAYIIWSKARAEERDRIHEEKAKRFDHVNYIRQTCDSYNKYHNRRKKK